MADEDTERWDNFYNGMMGPLDVDPYRANPNASATPDMAPGSVEAPTTGGLYALYEQSNPAQKSANRYASMAGMNVGGRLGALPGIVATFMSGLEQNKADKADAEKQAKIDKYQASLDAYNKIKNDRETAKYNSDMTEKALSFGWDSFSSALQNGKSFEEAGKAGADAVNMFAAQNKVHIPPVSNFHLWKGGEASLGYTSGDGKTIELVKKGDVMAWNDNGVMKPVPDDAMGFSDYAKITNADKPKSGPNPNGMLEYFDANDNLVAKTKDQAAAIAQGAVKVGQWVKKVDNEGNTTWDLKKVPLSKAPKKVAGDLANTVKPGQPPVPAAARQVAIQYNRPNPVPGSPGSGQMSVPTPAGSPNATVPNHPGAAPVQSARDRAIKILESQHAKLTEANIQYVVKQLPPQ